MHLGRSERSPATASPESVGIRNWRDERSLSGGGALLGSGYHLVDLVHYMFGSFDLVSASLWSGSAPLGPQQIDDRAWLVGRAQGAWVMMDSWVGGRQKSEGVLLRTNAGVWQADRSGVLHDGKRVVQSNQGWQDTMAEQLARFASNTRKDKWDEPAIWDQIPAMRVIDEAYRLAERS